MIMPEEEEAKPAAPEAPKKKGKGKQSVKKGKRVRTGRKHESKKPWTLYTVQGAEAARNREACPRCGKGTWLAKHKNRAYCGRCGYTIFERREAHSE